MNIIPKTLAELTDEILMLIEYSAPADEFDVVSKVLEKYSADRASLQVFLHFYSYLPEAREDGIIRISRVANRQGTFLLCVTTLFDNYLYLTSHEKAALIGPLTEGLTDQGLLEFFGWQDQEQFKSQTIDPAELPEHIPINETCELCPVCGTGEGELHDFGCPVEICPWCGGQLTNCECKFIKTGRDDFSHEAHLDELQDLLEAEGRIPFAGDEHRPSFMSEEE
jgi:hypothetical protein